MSATLAVSVAISAIESLLKFRAKADEILALKEAAADLPLDLPPAPLDLVKDQAKVLAFFDTEEGKLVLELRGETKDYALFRADPDGVHPAIAKAYFALYYDFTNTAPTLVGPKETARSVMAGGGVKLSYYVVESDRLSRNPALARLLLTSAETLLEFGGANAEMFVSNPKTRAILSSVLDDFLGQEEMDDASGGVLLKRMLGSVVAAAMENQGAIPESPAVSALFGALADLREAEGAGEDFVARIFTKPGFQTLVGSYLTKVAEDPAFLDGSGKFRPVLSAMLKDLAENSQTIFDDPKALFGVLEVAVTAAAGEVPGLLGKRVGDNDLMAAVLKSVLAEVQSRGAADALFKSVANGEIVSGLFQAALGAVAANSGALATTAKLDALTADLVSGVAGVLSKKALVDVLAKDTLRDLAAKSLQVLASNSAALGGDSAFTSTLLSGVLEAAASAVEDGLATSDVADVLDAAVRVAHENLALVKVPVPLEGLLAAVGAQLSEKGVRSVLRSESRMDLILASLETLSKNPKVWSGFDEADLVEPIVTAVLKGLASDSTDLVKGPIMVAAYEAVILTAARRGRQFIEGKATPSELEKVISMGLRKLDGELGAGVDADAVPAYLEALVEGYLKEPFELLAITTKAFKALHEKALRTA